MAKKNRLAGLVRGADVSPAPMSRDQEREHMRYRAEDALRTITRAEEIRCDKPLMREVKRVAKEQAKTLAKVCK